MSFTKRKPRIRPVFKLSAMDDQEKFKALPPASGPYPYRLNINHVLPDVNEQKMVFHIAGDTGNLWSTDYQRSVANSMTLQCNEVVSPGDRPLFLFHLGDVVYNFGQASEYYKQFFTPYKNYPAPIFAIPGNHDGDVDSLDPSKPQSLDAFRTVFCDTEIRPIDLAGDTNRQSNIQPHVYFTLQTPLANIIALYSNVPKFGTITAEQQDWFINELKISAVEQSSKALIVCIHHAPYSADTNHGSSLHMQQFLNGAFTAAQVWPDVVFSGHVHNYQRFNKTYKNGKIVPFIVSGAGGYSDLHAIAPTDDPLFPDTSTLLDDVELKKYCDYAHGFLKLTVTKEADGILLSGEYYITQNAYGFNVGAELYDKFEVDIKKDELIS
jgi:predicted phosphodiesterase